MPQTQDMTPPPKDKDTGLTCGAIHWCGTSHWKAQQPILMSWVRPNQGIRPRPSTHTGERSTLWCAMVVVSQRLGRKCTVPTGFWTRYLWCANPLSYLLAHSCFLYLSWTNSIISWYVIIILNPTYLACLPLPSSLLWSWARRPVCCEDYRLPWRPPYRLHILSPARLLIDPSH